jgi:periplasmic protein TonB
MRAMKDIFLQLRWGATEMDRNLIVLVVLASNLVLAQGAQPERGSERNLVESARKLVREEHTSPPAAPRKVFVGKERPDSLVVGHYVWTVEDKLRRIGNLTLQPATERASSGGTAIIQFEIEPTGLVNDVRIVGSSGSAALDSAALRVVRMSAPFSVFPAELKVLATSLVFVRSLTFPPSQVP